MLIVKLCALARNKNVTKHYGNYRYLKNIFFEGELKEKLVCANFAQTTYENSSLKNTKNNLFGKNY